MTNKTSEQHSGSDRNSKPRERAPKKITETYLHNSGLYYLQRFAASKAHFRSVMLRKVRKSCLHHKDQDFETCAALVEKLAERFEESGLLNDATYLGGMVRSLRRRGLSERAIVAKLAQKGIGASDTARALARYDAEIGAEGPEGKSDAERRAALVYCRRKKIGPYAKDNNKDPRKFMASLARGGFSFDTIRFVLNIDLGEYSELLSDAESL